MYKAICGCEYLDAETSCTDEDRGTAQQVAENAMMSHIQRHMQERSATGEEINPKDYEYFVCSYPLPKQEVCAHDTELPIGHERCIQCDTCEED